MAIKRTNRGFRYLQFKDRNAVPCSLQESSLATEPAIWLGADDIGLKVFGEHGWEDIKLEGQHVANNRMHLSRRNVKKLLPYLTAFAETGSPF